MFDRIKRVVWRATQVLRVLRGQLHEYANTCFGSGHVTLVENGKVLYDGPKANMPPDVKAKADALEAKGMQLTAEAMRMAEQIAQVVREHRKKRS